MEEPSSAVERSIVVEASTITGCGALDSALAASRSSIALRPPQGNMTESPRRDRLGQDFEKTTAVARTEEDRLGDNPDVGLDQSGRCACGNPGRRFVIIYGGEDYFCLTCFLREARSGRTPRAPRPPKTQLARAPVASGSVKESRSETIRPSLASLLPNAAGQSRRTP
jgi:hypothetical protein